ncbi:MAG: LysM peptidoglycan-binding domain-containing protein, partial [Deltaproteobacteria bacterium]|nr:LysM peptidoglycan-binding domain-containing protein [Deltaproteobacteria bacterium]
MNRLGSTTVGLAVVMLLVAGTAACSSKDSDQVKVTLVDAKSAPPPAANQGIVLKPGEDAGSFGLADEPDVNAEKLALQVKQERFILSKPGETIRLYSDWSGIPVEELKLLNDDKLPNFGQKYVLSLTASEITDFERKRQEYWGTRKQEMYDKYDIKTNEYQVKKNDTLDGISRKYDVPLWFLMVHNDAVDPYRLSPGTRLMIPRLEPRAAAKAEAPQGGDEAISEEDAREVFPVIVKKGETVGLYAKWGQVGVADIKRANRHLKTLDKVRIGDTINLPLTAKQFKRFQQLRQEYQAAMEKKAP